MALKIPRQILLSTLTIFLFLSACHTTSAYQFGQRWTRTATDGPGLSLGDAATLTWSVVPDGTNIPGEGLSDLIVDFDNAFNEPNAGDPDLTNRIWWQANQRFL